MNLMLGFVILASGVSSATVVVNWYISWFHHNCRDEVSYNIY